MMAGFPNDTSMEEILSSIKKIIADEGEGTRTRASARTRPRVDEAEAEQPAQPAEAAAEEVLELTEPLAAVEEQSVLMSPDAAIASREKLASLSAMIVKSDGGDNTLEGLVREMLRPMLKEWLDANLPVLVERIVAKEVARITEQGR